MIHLGKFGAGVNPLSATPFLWKGRYVLGLTNISDKGRASNRGIEGEIEEGFVAKTRGIQIMAGITFPFGGY